MIDKFYLWDIISNIAYENKSNIEPGKSIYILMYLSHVRYHL